MGDDKKIFTPTKVSYRCVDSDEWIDLGECIYLGAKQKKTFKQKIRNIIDTIFKRFGYERQLLKPFKATLTFKTSRKDIRKMKRLFSEIKPL